MLATEDIEKLDYASQVLAEINPMNLQYIYDNEPLKDILTEHSLLPENILEIENEYDRHDTIQKLFTIINLYKDIIKEATHD